jgi:hypothetical protein
MYDFIGIENPRKFTPLKLKTLQTLNNAYETLRTFVRFDPNGIKLSPYLPDIAKALHCKCLT